MIVEVLPKYSMSRGDRLCPNLAYGEFMCSCSYDFCDITLVNPQLLIAWEKMRNEWGSPILVTSGYRCQTHNKDIGGVDTSLHKRGSAIDIVPVGDKTNLVELDKIAKKYFSRTILYMDKKFIHCEKGD